LSSAGGARRNRPYRQLARFYDAILGGVAPAMNRHARERLLHRHWKGIRRVVDVCCGSGATAVDLAGRGIEVVAVDNSPDFVRAVRARARAAGVRVDVRRGDMRSFRVARPVDLVLCEFSALNHLERRADVATVFRAAARALRPGGLFQFDVNTPLSFQEQYAPTMLLEHAASGAGATRRPAFKFLQRGTLDDGGRRARLDYDWFVEERGLWRHHREMLWNVCWTEAELKRSLRAAGFRVLGAWDGIDVRPKIEGAGRGYDLYLLAQKPAR
jgi:SAM-dependent methyltransferase